MFSHSISIDFHKQKKSPYSPPHKPRSTAPHFAHITLRTSVPRSKSNHGPPAISVNDEVQLRDLLASRIVCCWVSPDKSTNYVTQYRCCNLTFCISLAVLKSIITKSYSIAHTQTVHVAHDNLRYCTRIF
jgi:hypothetical protein